MDTITSNYHELLSLSNHKTGNNDDYITSKIKPLPDSTTSGGLHVFEFFSGIGGMRLSLPSSIYGYKIMKITAFDCSDITNKVYLHNWHPLKDSLISHSNQKKKQKRINSSTELFNNNIHVHVNEKRSDIEKMTSTRGYDTNLEISTHSNFNTSSKDMNRNEVDSIESEILRVTIDGLKLHQVDGVADIWTMSPPCQPFTMTANAVRKDDKDNRSKAFLHLMTLLHEMRYKPRWIILENVKGFLDSKCLKLWKKTLYDNHYVWRQYLLSPIYSIGTPNYRMRYYMIIEHRSSLWASRLYYPVNWIPITEQKSLLVMSTDTDTNENNTDAVTESIVDDDSSASVTYTAKDHNNEPIDHSIHQAVDIRIYIPTFTLDYNQSIHKAPISVTPATTTPNTTTITTTILTHENDRENDIIQDDNNHYKMDNIDERVDTNEQTSNNTTTFTDGVNMSHVWYHDHDYIFTQLPHHILFSPPSSSSSHTDNNSSIHRTDTNTHDSYNKHHMLNEVNMRVSIPHGRSIGYYLQSVHPPLTTLDLQSLYFNDEILYKCIQKGYISIVTSASTESFCFTKSYSVIYDQSSGSFLYDPPPPPPPSPPLSSSSSTVPLSSSTLLSSTSSDIQSSASVYIGPPYEYEELRGKVRLFHPRELLALFGFPHWFQFPPNMALKYQYACIGNSINIDIVKAVMNTLFDDTSI